MNLDVDRAWPALAVAQEPLGALQHRLFIAFHVDLEDIQTVIAQVGIQANGPNPQAVGRARSVESYSRLAAAPGGKRHETVLTSHGCLTGFDAVREPIERDMALERGEVVGVRLESDHSAARANSPAQGKRVQSHVGADVGDDVTGPDT